MLDKPFSIENLSPDVKEAHKTSNNGLDYDKVIDLVEEKMAAGTANDSDILCLAWSLVAFAMNIHVDDVTEFTEKALECIKSVKDKNETYYSFDHQLHKVLVLAKEFDSEGY